VNVNGRESSWDVNVNGRESSWDVNVNGRESSWDVNATREGHENVSGEAEGRERTSETG
jgi:hypothetical protein